MALELVGLISPLYDAVNQAMGRSDKNKALLRGLESTLKSVQPIDIQQIGEYNLELGLSNNEVQSLRSHVEDGMKLVDKLSGSFCWTCCCFNDYAQQIDELDRDIKGLLTKLNVQGLRDMKELLELSRQNRDRLDDVGRRLSEMENSQQPRAGDAASDLVSGSDTKTLLPQAVENVSKPDIMATAIHGGAKVAFTTLMLRKELEAKVAFTMLMRPKAWSLPAMGSIDDDPFLVTETAPADAFALYDAEEERKDRMIWPKLGRFDGRYIGSSSSRGLPDDHYIGRSHSVDDNYIGRPSSSAVEETCVIDVIMGTAIHVGDKVAFSTLMGRKEMEMYPKMGPKAWPLPAIGSIYDDPFLVTETAPADAFALYDAEEERKDRMIWPKLGYFDGRYIGSSSSSGLPDDHYIGRSHSVDDNYIGRLSSSAVEETCVIAGDPDGYIGSSSSSGLPDDHYIGRSHSVDDNNIGMPSSSAVEETCVIAGDSDGHQEVE